MRPALLLLVVVMSSGFARGQDILKLTNELTANKKEFGKKKIAARDVALKQFDRVIDAVNRGPGSAAVKTALLKEWEEKKSRFNQDGEWPGDADLIGAGRTYGAALAKAFEPVSESYEKLIKAYGAMNDRDAAEKLVADKVAFEKQQFGGRERFNRGAMYHGSRYGGKNAISFHFNLGKFTGDVFEAVIHQNVDTAGHPIIEVKGVVEGLRLRCQSTKVVQGKLQAIAFDGYILGENVVLVIAAAGKNPEALAFLKLVNPPKK